MANNYMQPVDNHFNFTTSENLEDIDDDTFLNNSRQKPPSNSSFDGSSRSQMYAEKRREIEQRSLDSTQKSLGNIWFTIVSFNVCLIYLL